MQVFKKFGEANPIDESSKIFRMGENESAVVKPQSEKHGVHEWTVYKLIDG